MSSSHQAKGMFKRVPIAHYFLKELALFYNTSKFLLRKRLKVFKAQIGKPAEGFKYSPQQVELIFQLVELPSDVIVVKRRKKRNTTV